ncbi:putative T7SS-secreted protein [Streptomyces sp. NPDC059897]|uniref:putative T7SS-secreted protein n=1 Tax=Streptomyces sp. NPDC059897 TaxID=3346994 RepID=UPI003666917C
MPAIPTTGATYPALGFDPAPGTPGAVQALADDIRGAYAKLSAAQDVLTGIVRGSGGWTGVAADAFTAKVKDLPGLLATATDSFQQAQDALVDWQHQLASLQQTARGYEAQAEQARRRVRSAEAAPDLRLAGRTFTSEAELADAEQRLDAATQHLNQARGDLDRIIEDAQRLRQQHDSLGDQIAETLRRAAEEAPDKPGFFDRILEGFEQLAEAHAWLANEVATWVKEHANAIAAVGDVLSTLSTAIGVVGLALDATAIGAPAGAVLGAVSGGLAVGALATHGAAALGGADVSMRTFAEDAAGAISLGAGSAALKGAGIAERTVAAVVGGEKAIGVGGTFDSVWAAVEDSTAVGHFVPRDARQGAEMLVPGGGLAVAFENAWKTGSEKDRKAATQATGN